VPLIVGILAIITGTTALVRSCASPPPSVSVEYVLDISRSMAGKIGHKQKLQSVAAEIVNNAKDSPDIATALRLSGGGTCSTGYDPPAVPFAEHNGDKVQQALRNLRPAGKSDFARAMAHAVNDLVGREREVQGQAKTVFIFVGGPDTCSGGRSLEIIDEALRDLRAEKEIAVTLKFVGVEAPARVKTLLRSAANEARRLKFESDVVIADRPDQLADALPQQPTPRNTQYSPGS
jgi:hypothetical protein